MTEDKPDKISEENQTGSDAAPDTNTTKKRSFVYHAKLVAIFTLFSRVLGLARDAILAFVFGMTGVMDAFVIAFMIPNLFRRLFGEGSLTGAFIPHYTQLVEEDPASGKALAWKVLKTLFAFLTGLYLLAAMGIGIWLMFQDGEGRSVLAAQLTLITLAYMPLVCVVAILGAILQVHHRFIPAAAAPVLLNIAIITAALVAYYSVPQEQSTLRITIVAIAVVFAGIVQISWLAIAKRQNDPVSLGEVNQQSVSDRFKRILKQWGPTTFGLAILQLNALADLVIVMLFSAQPGEQFSLFGSTYPYPMETGAVAVLNAAQRLFQFPLGVFGIAVATAIFPALASAAKDSETFGRLIRQGLRLTLYIGLPASLGLLLVREQLASAIFHEGGQLVADDALRIATVLMGYAPAVWAYSINQVSTRAFYAQNDPNTPLKVAITMLVVNLTLNLTLIWPLGEAGVAWSTCISAILQCGILLFILRGRRLQLFDASSFVSIGKIVLLSALMIAGVWGVLQIPDTAISFLQGRLLPIGQLVLATATGAAVIFGGSLLLRCEELKWILKKDGLKG